MFAYALYIPLSEATFAFLYPLGWLTGHPYDQSRVRAAEWFFIAVSYRLELLTADFYRWYRDLFVR